MGRGKLEPAMIAKQFKKGQVANPEGARAHDPEMRMLKRLTKEEMKEVGNLVLMGNVDSLKGIGKDPKSSALKTMLASVCVRVISKGDMQAFDILLNRLIGKVKDEVEHSGMVARPKVILTMPANGREKKPDEPK